MTSIDVETRLVQLSSAATTFNTTLNLTGPIILGVTIAFGSLLYAYSKAYPPQLSVAGNIGLLSDSLSSLAKPSGGYGRGFTKRAAEERDQEQEAALGAVLDTFSLLQSVEDSLALIGVDTADCQLRAVCDIVAGTFPAPAVDTVTQVVRVAVSKLRRVQLSLVQPVLRPWLLAAEAGKRGERCGASYRYCGDTRYGDKLRLQLATW